MSERLVGESWEWFNLWLDGKAESTKRQYLSEFIWFLTWLDWDSEQLKKEYLDDLRKSHISNINKPWYNPTTKKRIPKSIFMYQKHRMEKDGIKGTSTEIIEKVIIGFFKANELEFKMNGISNIEKVHEGKDAFTKTELRTLIDVTGNMRNKSIITFLKDSGLRSGDLCRIQVKHIREALTNSCDFYTFEFKQEKTRKQSMIKANPCMGPESLKYLRIWMKQRKERYGIPDDDNGYVFCALERKSGYTTKHGRVIKRTEVGDKLTSRSIAALITTLMKKGDIDRNVSAHSARKFVRTNLEAGGCPSGWVDKIIGKKTPGTSGTYRKPSPEQIIKFYSEAYSHLALFEFGLNDEVAKVREENDELKTGLKELETRMHFLESLLHSMSRDPDLQEMYPDDIRDAFKKENNM